MDEIAESSGRGHTAEISQISGQVCRILVSTLTMEACDTRSSRDIDHSAALGERRGRPSTSSNTIGKHPGQGSFEDVHVHRLDSLKTSSRNLARW